MLVVATVVLVVASIVLVVDARSGPAPKAEADFKGNEPPGAARVVTVGVMTSTSNSTWPTFKAQQKICKRGDTVVCVGMGAPGCELCTPCRYTDEELAARRLPVQESRASHAEHNAAHPDNGHVCPSPKNQDADLPC